MIIIILSIVQCSIYNMPFVTSVHCLQASDHWSLCNQLEYDLPMLYSTDEKLSFSCFAAVADSGDSDEV